MAALRTAVVRPRLKPWIDAFLTVSHTIGSEEQLADFAANDPFVQAGGSIQLPVLILFLVCLPPPPPQGCILLLENDLFPPHSNHSFP